MYNDGAYIYIYLYTEAYKGVIFWDDGGSSRSKCVGNNYSFVHTRFPRGFSLYVASFILVRSSTCFYEHFMGSY
jgi:hypothetical protein